MIFNRKRKLQPPKMCSVPSCGRRASDYKLDGLADRVYYCSLHANPPRIIVTTWDGVSYEV